MKKLLASLGAMAAIVTPIAPTISCGSTGSAVQKEINRDGYSDSLISNARRVATLVYTANDKVNILLKDIQSLTQRRINAMIPIGHMSTPSYTARMAAEEHARQVGLTGVVAASYINSAGSSHWVEGSPNYALANSLATQISYKKQEANTEIVNFNNPLLEAQQIIQKIEDEGVEIPSDLINVEDAYQKNRIF